MKKTLTLLIAAVLLLPACGWSSKSKNSRKPKKQNAMKVAEVDIPVVSDEITSYFDEDVNEFELVEATEETPDFEALVDEEIEQAALDNLDDDFFWIEDIDETFKNVYFGFDQDDVTTDQEEYIAHNVSVAKKMIDDGESPSIIIEGNACSSAGSRAYNMAISNNRAEKIASKFVENGVSRENIKIVGRGSDSPALDEDGSPIKGDKDQQWQNRRVEISVYS